MQPRIHNTEMKQPPLRILFILFSAIVIIFSVIGGCANPIAPQGGPKDTLAPLVMVSAPRDSSMGFTGNKITFTFNEFIQLDNVRENLIVSPTPKVDPIVESKLRTLTIKIKDTLEPNTTYTYNFGNAIKDVNEGNIAKNFTYVFSTGKSIDSFQLSGKVIMAQDGKTDSTLIAMLHRNGDDSAVIKEKPRYVARIDGSGNFHFRNLPSGTFYLYALKDESGQRKYLSRKQAFAFAGKPISIGAVNTAETLYAFVEKDTAKPVAAAPPIGRLANAAAKTDKAKEQDKRLRFSNNLDNGQLDLLGNLEFSFPDKLKKFDSSKVVFTDDTYKPITDYTFSIDTSFRKITLKHKWTENTPFHLLIDKEFAEDSLGRTISRNDTLHFRTKKESDYGSIRLSFSKLDFSKKPVLQLMTGEQVVYSEKLASLLFYVKLFKPGEYEIRILEDANGNGIWDSGEFFIKHLQPERVIPVKKKLVVKANWDNEVRIEL